MARRRSATRTPASPPEPRHHILKPWGAEAEPLLALRGGTWSAGYFGHCSSQRMCSTVCLHLVLHLSVLAYYTAASCKRPGHRLVGDGTASVKGFGRDTTKAFATSSVKALVVSLLFPGSPTEAPQGLLERRLMNYSLTLNLIIFCHCESQRK